LALHWSPNNSKVLLPKEGEQTVHRGGHVATVPHAVWGRGPGGHRGGDFGEEEVHIGDSSRRGGWTDRPGPDQKGL